jgi:signal transduction histidine kinase/DNA-directed RNA polymerase subunit N (RpoN/RPB10)
MKLTKQLRSEILDVYEAFLGSLFNVDLEIYSLLLDDNYRLIGTTDKEVFFNKKDAISFLKATADQLAGNVERRKSEIKIEVIENLVLITEQCDGYVLIENDWTFYAKLRVSTWMQQMRNEWKIVQQHFSIPDTKAEEGQTIGLEKISKENIELRDAVKRRTVELEVKNRELQIEAALEKVRSRTMAMQHSDELPETSYLLFQQLKELGETAAQLSIGIIKEKDNIVELSATVHGSQMLQTYKIPIDEPYVMKKVIKTFKEKQKSLMIEIKGKELKGYNDWRNSVLKTKIVFPEKQWIVHVVFFSKGFLSFSSDQYHPKETIELLERFAGVFDLTYTRFLDLKNAEAQVREALIEAALERVRSQTIAMHKSDELKEIIIVISEQLQMLGYKFSNVSFITHNTNYDLKCWMSAPGVKEPILLQVPYLNNPAINNLKHAVETDIWFSTAILTVDENLEWNQHVINTTWLKDGPQEFKDYLLRRTPYAVTNIRNKHIAFAIGNYAGVPYKDEENEVFKRFANVFEQSYTRFLDLQKAEAQSREAQIELGLERVRARAMAMQNSDELKELIATVFIELTKLDLVLTRCLIMIYDPVSNGSTWWMANSEAPAEPIGLQVQYHEHPPFLAYLNAWKEKQLKWTYTLEGNIKKEWDDFLFVETELSHLPHFVIAGMKAPDRVYLNASFNSFGNLTLATLEPLSDEHFDIMLRFAKVFDLTYTRFNDLQKAEAQAREAQIEVALERVRSKTMAMHNSSDLLDVINLLADQFQMLGFKIHSANFNTSYRQKDWNLWLYNPGTPMYPEQIHIPYLDHPFFNRTLESIANGSDFTSFVFTKEEKDGFLKHLYSTTIAKNVSEERKRFTYNAPGFAWSTAYLKNTALTIANYDAEPYTEEQNTIIRRFGKVFEQTYTRFLDLQKAEAQAREAKIEAALEKVRSRSLAMHKSEEIQEVINEVFIRLRELEINLDSANILIFEDGTKDVVCWTGSIAKNSTSSLLRNADIDFIMDLNKANENKVELFTHQYTREQKNNFFNYVYETTVLKETPDDRKQFILSAACHTVAIAFSKNIAINLNSYSRESFTESEINIAKRFAKVFEQSYRRFLDLQKAEAQARESLIELGLERVRARAMAMRKSDELSELVDTVFKELTKLDFALNWCIINIIDESSMSNTVWAANPDINKPPESYHMLFEDYPFHHAMMKGWKERNTKCVYVLEGQEKKVYDEYLFNETEFRRVPEAAQAASRAMEKYVVTFSFSNFGGLQTVGDVPLSDTNLDILSRFGKVFDLTYTRFNDLKQAEAQAREAQIEAGLERVRSRSLAMHNTSELQEVIHTVHKELLNLNLSIDGGSFVVINDDIGSELRCWGSGGTANTSEEMQVPFYNKPICTYLINKIKNGPGFFTEEYTQQEKKEFFTFLFKHEPWSQLDAKRKKEILSRPGGYTRSCSVSQHTSIFIINHFGKMFTTAENEILNRFGKVFDQTYTRFLDLLKAEAQAREAQIEAALERVRSRTMGMQKSEELKEVIQVVYEQFVHLNIQIEHTGFIIDYKASDDLHIWLADQHLVPSEVTIPCFDSPPNNSIKEAKEKRQDFFKYLLTFEEKNKFYRELFKFVPDVPEESLEYYSNCPGLAGSGVLLDNIGLYIENFSGTPYTDEENKIVMRFGKVFQQTYTRFIDLQKAEAQAREAKIEAALERTRTQSMIMQHSTELDDVLRVFHEQVLLLGINSAFSFLWLPDEDKDRHIFWAAWGEEKNGSTVFNSKAINYPLDRNEPATAQCLVDWKSNEPVYSYHVPPSAVENYFAVWSELIAGVEQLNPEYFSGGLYYVEAFMKYGCFGVMVRNELKEDEKKILARFAVEFERTYTRFLDLQKAEAQAREAKIEAALERVRAQAMAMHQTEDLGKTIMVYYEQLDDLIDSTIVRCGAGLLTKKNTIADMSTASKSPEGDTYNVKGTIDMRGHPLLESTYEHWLRQEEHNYVLRGNEIKEYYQHITNQVAIPENSAGDELYFYFPMFTEGSFYVVTNNPVPENELQIFRRFSSVLSLTYRRFNDLQKAEAQTRQAQIETAMEKVRARAMAMQKPKELIEVAQLLRKEMGLLGVEELETSSIYIHDEASGNTECWYAIKKIQDDETKLVTDHMIIKLQDTWVGRQMLDFYHSDKKQISIPMQGANRKEWIHYCTKHSKAIEGFYGENIPDRTYHLNKFSNGYIGAASPGNISSESWDLLQRATSVFSLAYTRFSDLQIAEASTREAVRQAALDRIRADIASMRTVQDLQRITPLIWDELTIIGIPFIRCGVFIMDEPQKLIHTFLSTPDGKAIGAFHLPYTTLGNIQLVLNNWRKKKSYVDHWNEDAFIEFADILMKQGAFNSPDQYLSSIPHGGFHLHFLPFLQGMLYVGNTTQLGEDEIRLIQSVADAFSTAYARYEDFNKLEAAKQQVENTLTDLKQAQQQLVQSEKMASLGELTAGIAHEIQNPLNFVNNFSEVSNELLQEMMEEVEKGNYDFAKEIATDVKQNLEKINHHGKRAGDIVKGMLQHSRSSSGVKEPTNINALADEYFRLAYHGLRAKDKSFNATMKTDFDESLENINIIPQDIGRVVLNLINNAFYAVDEKKKQNQNGYEPTVSVSTKKINGKIEIKVADNGNGIPQKALDKIFQPFFTTKPTGQGTGLGLSLSYDIVKAHGGEIKVETKEGEGSEFVISLPG